MAAERTRTLVKLAGSISLGARASRHSSEFAAKHSIATLVKTTVRATRRPGFALMYASRDAPPPVSAAAPAILRGNMVGEPCRVVADAGQE